MFFLRFLGVFFLSPAKMLGCTIRRRSMSLLLSNNYTEINSTRSVFFFNPNGSWNACWLYIREYCPNSICHKLNPFEFIWPATFNSSLILNFT
uniref:Secreted protein n=1 Tax=Kalanchoe fedtschenkoi TaxID=63787 RepID=A0A7N0T1X1_KALFE